MVDDPDSSTWLSIADAAHAYGWNARTVRRKVQAGQLAAHQVPGKFGPEWRVAPPADYQPPARSQPTPDPVSTPSPGQALIPLDNLERLLAPLDQERRRLQDELEQARREIADLQAARLADAQEIGRLQGRLEAVPPPDPPPPRRRWPWQR